jgi:riboflavin kinase/FMN adenylyltransferase
MNRAFTAGRPTKPPIALPNLGTNAADAKTLEHARQPLTDRFFAGDNTGHDIDSRPHSVHPTGLDQPLPFRGNPPVIPIQNVRDLPARARGAYVTVGNFDAVHRGHQRLLARLRSLADAANVPALALTFDPHSVSLLRPESAPVPLAWPEREVELLLHAGATEVGVFQTGPWLLQLSAREFFDQVIRQQLGAVGMVEGPNFAFGRDREGDVHTLANWCVQSGIAFEVVEPTLIDGQLVSSSRIRKLLSEGSVESAADLLGRFHRIQGLVAHGAGRGAGLGFPTLNLVEVDVLIPAEGVYAAFAKVEGTETWRPAACNIGPNPTFGEQLFKVEAHLLDFSQDIYGKTVELDFVKRLRSTRKFAGLDDLLHQIELDVAETRRVCEALSASSSGRGS